MQSNWIKRVQILGTILFVLVIGGTSVHRVLNPDPYDQQARIGVAEHPIASAIGAVAPSIILAPFVYWMFGRVFRRNEALQTSPPKGKAAEGTQKFLKWIVVLIALGLAGFAVQYGQQWLRDDATGLTGAARSTFVESALGGCLKKQNENPASKLVSPSVISQYCACYANGVADRISIHELKAMATTSTQMASMFQPKVEAAAKPCIEAIASPQAQP
jgi:hypothetical protein